MADFHMLFLCATVIHAYVGFIQTGAVTATYSEDVEKVFQNLKNNVAGMSSCIKTARNKMKKFSNFEQDNMYAAGIINLYTYECPPEPQQFYKVLNNKLRNGQADGVWKLAGDLINEAIDLLSTYPNTYSKVYRGCTEFDNIPEEGESCFRFNQITSTSKDVWEAIGYADCGYVFKIRNVSGLFAKKYSQHPKENEVILKSTHSFDVIKVIKGTSEIKMELGVKAKISTLIILDGGETPTCKGWKTVPTLSYFLSLVVFSIKFL